MTSLVPSSLSVSVVIPSYNCDQYIAKAITSALGQNPYEVIVVDDGSSDHTREVVASFAQDNLRYEYQVNQGVSAARNRGIELARGDLVAFLDADDWFLPNKLAQQAALFEADPKLGLVQSGWQRVADNGEVLAEVRPWETIPSLTIENWLRFKPVLPSALIVRRDWLNQAGGFDIQFQAAEDIELVSRLILHGCPAAWLPQVAVSYRQRTKSAMGDGLTQARDLHKFLDKFFQQPDLPMDVQMLEKSVRYHTLVWAAWYLLHTGCKAEMVQHLQDAWGYSPYLPIEALTHWVESFSTFSKNWQSPLDMMALTQSHEWQALVRWLFKQTHKESA